MIKSGMVCWLLLILPCLRAENFDAAAFAKALQAEPDATKAALLNKTANEIKFALPDQALDYAIQAQSWAEKTGNLREQAQALLHQSMAIKIKQDFPKALQVNRLALSLAEKNGDSGQVAQIKSFMGLILSDLGEIHPSIDYTRQALAYYQQVGDERRIATMNNNLGARYYRLGDYARSLDYQFASLQVEEKMANDLGMANNLNMIGINYLALKEPVKARTYLEKARDLYVKLDEKNGMALVLGNLGISCKDMNDLQGALSAYRLSMQKAEENGNRVLISENLLNIGEIHQLRRELDAALASYHQALSLAQEMNDFNTVATCYVNIGEIHLQKGDETQATLWLKQALALAREKGYMELIQGSLENLKELYKRQGDHAKALASMEEWLEVRDKVLSEQKNKAMLELETRYTLDKKEKELELLKRDQDLQKLLLASERQRFYIATLAALLFLVGLFLLGKRYRRLFIFWKKKSYIGHYQVGERLGGGGFGDVYKAYSVRDANLPVALKLLREEYARDPLLRQRFLNEAKVIDRLDHPHIVKVLERGETNDRLYLAMEFIDGKTLAEIIKENPRLPLEFCFEVMKQLLGAVEALHHQGVLHRDLKPDNVMVIGGLSDSPHIKLMDFDLARDVRMTPLTQTGELLGTLPYMPPERISGQICSEAGDLYSLGVLFYEMITGEKPFPADTPVEVMKQVLDIEPVSADRLRSDIPTLVSGLLSALLNKDMAARPDVQSIRSRLDLCKIA